MRILDDSQKEYPIPARSFMTFGIFLLGYIVYCLLYSSPECILHFGKGGLRESCGEQLSNGYLSLSIALTMSMLFLFTGYYKYEKSRPEKKHSVSRLLLASIFIIFSMLAIFRILLNLSIEAKKSYVRSIGQALHTAEQSYKKEWNKYTADLRDAGFSIFLDDLKIYTSVDEIPLQIRQQLTPTEIPHVSTDEYKIIILYYDNHNRIQLWITNQSGESWPIRTLSPNKTQN